MRPFVHINVLHVASALWLGYMLYLDIRYERFPDVSMGGIMILVVVCLVFVGLRSLFRLLRKA